MTRWLVMSLGIVLSVGMTSASAWAADPGLAAEVELLKERLASLEGRLEAQQAGASAGSSVLSLPSGLHGIEMSGFVDTAYGYNFNEPDGGANSIRAFDVNANSFTLHNIQLNFEKAAEAGSPVGFKTSLMFGDDAELTHSSGLFGVTDAVDIQQAYVEYLAPVGEGLSLKFGKMATLIGAEVIESVDNWNHSRSLAFFYAIPFTHTGLRASYPLSDTLSITTGVNNGWDIADDTNSGKGIEGQIAWAPTDEFFISFNGMYSSESTATGAGTTIKAEADRWIGDIVATYQATDDLALMLNYDYGYQADASAIGSSASWQALAAYAKYDLTDTCSLIGRYEYFWDWDAFRTGVGVSEVDLQEITITAQHQVNDHLITRLEYRHDWADADVFTRHDGASKNQDTIAVEDIVPF